MKPFYQIITSLFFILSLTACNGLLDPDMRQNASEDQIDDLGKTNPEAIITITNALVQGMYAHTGAYQGTHDLFGIMAINLAGDLSTDDMLNATFSYFSYDYEIDNRNATYSRPDKTWTYCYTLISKANEVISKIDPATTNNKLKANLGQALAMRAQGLHIAIQRFQQTYKGNETAPGIPIYLTEKDGKASVYGRGTVQQVYDRIFKDYLNALTYLEGYTRTGKTMVDQQVTAGLLARAYMTTGEWANAQKYANMARQGYSLMNAEQAGKDGYNDIQNEEWMWGFDTNSENTLKFASFQSHMSTFDVGYAGAAGAYKVIDKKLFGQFAADDARKNLYITTSEPINGVTYPFGTNHKFKPTAAWLSDNPYMRVSEMVLIEAEALAQLNKTTEAATVLKELMTRRSPSWNKTQVTVEDVFLQKRLELWGEGVIMYDYLRLKKGLSRNYPGSNHSYAVNLPAGDWRFIYQIPQDEIDNNNEISESDQNP